MRRVRSLAALSWLFACAPIEPVVEAEEPPPPPPPEVIEEPRDFTRLEGLSIVATKSGGRAQREPLGGIQVGSSGIGSGGSSNGICGSPCPRAGRGWGGAGLIGATGSGMGGGGLGSGH